MQINIVTIIQNLIPVQKWNNELHINFLSNDNATREKFECDIIIKLYFENLIMGFIIVENPNTEQTSFTSITGSGEFIYKGKSFTECVEKIENRYLFLEQWKKEQNHGKEKQTN